MTLGMQFCERCQCNDAYFSIEFDDPERGKRHRFALCRPCQTAVVSQIWRCQGMDVLKGEEVDEGTEV